MDSKILLLDTISGNFLAIMDANWITTMRTGAVAAHSINLFGKNNYTSIGIIGLGNTARATVLVLSELVKDRVLRFRLLNIKVEKNYLKQDFLISKILSLNDSYIDIVKESDIVVSCVTYFNSDICPDEYFKEGVTVIPVHTRGFSNCDLFFDKVFADDMGHVCHFKYFDKFKKFA